MEQLDRTAGHGQLGAGPIAGRHLVTSGAAPGVLGALGVGEVGHVGFAFPGSGGAVAARAGGGERPGAGDDHELGLRRPGGDLLVADRPGPAQDPGRVNDLDERPVLTKPRLAQRPTEVGVEVVPGRTHLVVEEPSTGLRAPLV